MAFCVAESFARLGRYNRVDIARNFVRWHDEGFWSSLPHAFDVGHATHVACRAIARNGSFVNGEEESQGNGSIMRFAPSYLMARALDRPEIIHEVSDITHASSVVRKTCDRMASILDELFATGETTVVSHYSTREACDNSGWCVSTLESALWALNATDTFEEALVAAVNLGGDSDSIGAVCGQLAGAKYGYSAIPERWLAAIKDRAVINALFSQFMAALPQAPIPNDS
jgi:ADP-ribosyl-[dinitrogen reductase] hydrolase